MNCVYCSQPLFADSDPTLVVAVGAPSAKGASFPATGHIHLRCLTALTEPRIIPLPATRPTEVTFDLDRGEREDIIIALGCYADRVTDPARRAELSALHDKVYDVIGPLKADAPQPREPSPAPEPPRGYRRATVAEAADRRALYWDKEASAWCERALRRVPGCEGDEYVVPEERVPTWLRPLLPHEPLTATSAILTTTNTVRSVSHDYRGMLAEKLAGLGCEVLSAESAMPTPVAVLPDSARFDPALIALIVRRRGAVQVGDYILTPAK